MNTENLFPINRFISPRRAILVTIVQTLFALAVFLLCYFAGAALGFWPRPPFGETMPNPARVGMIVSITIPVIIIQIIRKGVTNSLFSDYTRAALLIRERDAENAISYLESQIEKIHANPFWEKYRSLLLFDYSDLGYEESSLISLAFIKAAQGKAAESRALLKEAKAFKEEETLVDEYLRDFGGMTEKARAYFEGG